MQTTKEAEDSRKLAQCVKAAVEWIAALALLLWIMASPTS